MTPAQLHNLSLTLTDNEFETLLRWKIQAHMKHITDADFRVGSISLYADILDSCKWTVAFGKGYPYTETRGQVLSKCVEENFRRLGFLENDGFRMLEAPKEPQTILPAPTGVVYDDEIPL